MLAIHHPMSVLPIKMFNNSKNKSLSFFKTFLSCNVSLTKHRALLCWALLCSAVQNQGNFYAQEVGSSVNPAAFDRDETVLDEACWILPLQPLVQIWKQTKKKSNYLMPFKSVTLLRTVESKIFRAVASGVCPPFRAKCPFIMKHIFVLVSPW